MNGKFLMIKKHCSIGDNVTLTTSDNLLISGVIFDIDDSVIVVEDQNGNQEFICGSDILNFTKKKEISCPNQANDSDVKSTISEEIQEDSVEKNRTELNPDNDDTTSVNNGLKIIGKIPLEDLYEKDPSLKEKIEKAEKKREKRNQKAIVVGNTFDVLAPLVESEHELENEKIIPAIGHIERCFVDKMFGFIYDSKTQKSIHFSCKEIIDKKLAVSLTRGTSVIYSISNNRQGETATSIHKPGSIKSLVDLSKQLSENGDYLHSVEVLEHILSEYPNNYTAGKLKIEIEKFIPQWTFQKKTYSNLYTKAKKHDQKKEYDLALDCYFKALEKGEKVESCIKDIASMYANLYRQAEEDKKEKYRQKGISFLQKYANQLQNTMSNLQHLENIYYSIKDYDNFIVTADSLIDDDNYTRDKRKHSYLLAKKASVLLQQDKKDEALDCVEEALSIDGVNTFAQKLKAIIEQPESLDSVEEIISEHEFDSLKIGLSPFINQTIEEYDEFYGVPTKIIESDQLYTEKTLIDIRRLIETAGRARAKERAKYLLSEAKLMMEVEPSEDIRLNSIMARYCNAMALSHISENSSMDIIRFYYNEAFSLEESFDATARQVVMYLMTYHCSYRELLDATAQNISVDTALTNCITTENRFLWDGILSMFLFNSAIPKTIIRKLYENPTFKRTSILGLKQIGIDINDTPSSDDYFAAWNKARETRLNEYKGLVARYNSLSSCTSIEKLNESMDILLRQNEEPWICALDKNRINALRLNIKPSIDSYIRTSGYRNKETNYNNAKSLLRQMHEEINDGPTKFSFDAILPLVQKTQELLDSSFDIVTEASEPRINMTLLSDNTIVNEEGMVSLQIAVSNHKDSSPIREVSLAIKDTKEILYIPEDNKVYNAIEGGDEQIFKLKIKVSDNIIQSKATAVDVICSYKSGNEEKTKESCLSVRLYSSELFINIENPYSPIADGGPVPIESNMFYGREEFISNIVHSIIESESKQIIIYGQKRCGKSSVLLHLKKALEETNKTFCISFSLGDIIQNLSEVALYYKILRSIMDELEMQEDEGVEIPEFSLPNYTDFKNLDTDNPLNTFTSYMSKFKKACKRNDDWKDKRLVVMIDEFTYLYSGIKRGEISPSIMKQWKAITQNPQAQFSVVLVGQDVVPLFKNEDYAKNAFGIIQDIRLTYLQEEPARALIEQPILFNGESRYVGNAVSRIIDYTSRNPYYIQIFCARLVEYMNRKKIIKVTEADVDDVAYSFVVGDQALSEDKFDNLIRAGEEKDFQEIPEDDILRVLRQISLGSKNIGFCNRSDIDVFEDKQKENKILNHLISREVLEKRGDDNYKIQVKLFQEWLLTH